jgi:hypothetical protein
MEIFRVQRRVPRHQSDLVADKRRARQNSGRGIRPTGAPDRGRGQGGSRLDSAGMAINPKKDGLQRSNNLDILKTPILYN